VDGVERVDNQIEVVEHDDSASRRREHDTM